MIFCDNCENPYKPEASRWLCPMCGYKGSCCEGEVCRPFSTPESTLPYGDTSQDNNETT